MLRSVELEDDLSRVPSEVSDIAPDRRLPAKMHAERLHAAQKPPHFSLGIRRLASQRLSAAAYSWLDICSRHMCGLLHPHPCPSPRGGGVKNHQRPSGFFSSSGKYFSTESNGFGAAWPSPQIEASRISAASSSRRAGSHGPLAIRWAAFSVPTRHGVHWPQLSSSKNLVRLSATAFMSSLSDRITTAWEPTKQPYFFKVPKSSGMSAMDAGRMPPEAPPGR